MGNSLPGCCPHNAALADQTVPEVPALKIADDASLRSTAPTETPQSSELEAVTQEPVLDEDGGRSAAFDAKTEDPLAPTPEACEVTVADISGTRECEKPLDRSDDCQITNASLMTLDSTATAWNSEGSPLSSARMDCRRSCRRSCHSSQIKAKEKRRDDESRKQSKRETERRKREEEERRRSEQKKQNDLKHAEARRKEEEARKKAEKKRQSVRAKTIKPMLAKAGKYLAELIEEGNAKMVRDLIEFGANPDEPDENGLVPLKAACGFDQVECVKVLLEMKANVNLKGRGVAGHISTALHIACKNGCEENIRALLAAGADPTAKNDHDQLPSHLAEMYHKRNAVKMLKMHMEKNGTGLVS